MNRDEFRVCKDYYGSKGWDLRVEKRMGGVEYIIERHDNASDEYLTAESLDELWEGWSELVSTNAEFQVKMNVLKQWAFSKSPRRQKAVRSFIEDEGLDGALFRAMDDAVDKEVFDKDFEHHESLVKEISTRYLPEYCEYDDYEEFELLREEIGDYVAS